MSEEPFPFGLVPIPGMGPIGVLPGVAGRAGEIAKDEGLGGIPQRGAEVTGIAFDQINENLKAFAVGILGIGGLMGFALWLFLMGKGLSALGINLQDEEE